MEMALLFQGMAYQNRFKTEIQQAHFKCASQKEMLGACFCQTGNLYMFSNVANLHNLNATEIYNT